MSLHSKWEARIVIPTGNWVASFTDTGGTDATAVTLVAANTYYWSSDGNDSNTLVEEIQDQLNASGTLDGTFTVTIGAGESGTGKLTIASTVAFTNSWTSTDLRNLCGFNGNISSTTSAVGNTHVEALWLPDCPVETPYGLGSRGLPISTGMISLSEDGTYTATHGSKHTRNEYTYSMVSISKVVQTSESTIDESYETFWLDAIRGEEPWANAGRELRFYKDTDADNISITYNVTAARSPDIQRASQDWDGFWTVHIEVAHNPGSDGIPAE